MLTGLIAKYCGGVASGLVAAIIMVESSGNPLAEHDGNYGAMQIRLNTAKFMQCEVLDNELCGVDTQGNKILSCKVTKPEQLKHAATNIKCGCKYLLYQKKRYNNDRLDMAAAYNLGSVFKNQDGTYKNQSYVNSVKKVLK